MFAFSLDRLETLERLRYSKEQCTNVCTKITPVLLLTLYLVRIHAAYLIVNLLLVLCWRRFLQVLGESLSVVWLTRDVILVLLFAVSSATASFVEASSINFCQVFFSFFASFRETVCFPFFWATLTPVISCANRDTLVLPDSASNASSVTSSKPSSRR